MKNKTLKLIIVLAVAAAIVAGAAFFYQKGYRLSLISGVYKNGSVKIISSADGVDVYVDGKKKVSAAAAGQTLTIGGLKPGRHSVLAAKEGYWPWQKNLTVESEATTEARTLFVPTEPQGKILFSPQDSSIGNTPEELAKRGKILKDILLSQNSLEKTKIGVSLFSDEARQNLSAEWLGPETPPYFICGDAGSCQKITPVFNSKFQIKTFDFYPGRNDVAIVAVEDGVYALEIDGRGGRMLQPIYKGNNPMALAAGDEPLVYILDDNFLLEINLR
ncbi:MAG: PEGA domain-containing protein [Candidatus Pacebacteria bacterium]|nr:PEGA domain-containing protein [Candidatus Paceibacterota bacterium]NUQ57620.1 PEGA domain-containing protein [Candidatus Paceibacter sp.]